MPLIYHSASQLQANKYITGPKSVRILTVRHVDMSLSKVLYLVTLS